MKILLSVLLVVLGYAAAGQSVLPLRADTVLIEKTGGSAELKIRNSTRDTLGVFVNIGGGKTKFIKSKKLNDSTFVVGLDTITMRGSASTDTTHLSDRINLRVKYSDTTSMLSGYTRLQRFLDSCAAIRGAIVNIYNSDGSIAGTRTINFLTTGILNLSNLLATTIGGSSFGIQGQPAHLLMQHFETNAHSQQIYLGNIAHEGIRIGINAGSIGPSIVLDTLNKFSFFNVLSGGGSSSDSALYWEPSSGKVRYGPKGVSGTGSVTLINTGTWLTGGPITSTGTINADSATISGYLIRRKDSTTAYVTPKRLLDTATALRLQMVNFANANLTLTGDRSHTFGSNQMQFKGDVTTNGQKLIELFPNTSSQSGYSLFLRGDGDDFVQPGIVMLDQSAGNTIKTYLSNSGSAFTITQDALSGRHGDLVISANDTYLRLYNGASSVKNISLNNAANSAIAILDTKDTIGLRYEQDYSTKGVNVIGDRWIPDLAGVRTDLSTGGAKVINTTKLQSHNYVRAGDSIYNVAATKTSVYYGTSIVQGTVTPLQVRWTTRVSAASNVIELNRGIGGSLMVHVSPGDSCMFDRIYTIPVYNSAVHDRIFFGYAINDLSQDSAVFRSTYYKVLDSTIIARGWPADKVVLMGCEKAFTSIPIANLMDTAFNRIVGSIATVKGTKYVNTYPSTAAIGRNAVQTDGVHPNEFGHEIIALCVVDSLKLRAGNVRATGFGNFGGIIVRQMAGLNGMQPAITAIDTAGHPIFDIKGYWGGDVYNASLGIGELALPVLKTGTNNYAFGQQALFNDTTGSFNVAVGSRVLESNGSGNRNTAVGIDALRFNTASDNTAVGYSALNVNTAGTGNVAVGSSALLNTTGNNNSGLGIETLFTNTSGANNTAMGSKSMRGNTTGGNNTGVGNSTMIGNTTGGNNTAIGNGAFQNNITGSFNTGIGSNAFTAATGSNNVGMGYQVGDVFTGGSSNTLIGTRTGHALTGTSSNNTWLGAFAGLQIANANNTIVLTTQYNFPATYTANKKMYIGQDNDSITIYSDDALNVAIGDTVAGAKLDVNGTLKVRSIANGTVNVDSPLVSHASVVNKIAPTIAGSFSQVGAATTVFTVTIGATQANTTYKVQVTPTAALSAALFYVTNKTTTTFDVTYIAGLTGTVTFDWVLHP